MFCKRIQYKNELAHCKVRLSLISRVLLLFVNKSLFKQIKYLTQRLDTTWWQLPHHSVFLQSCYVLLCKSAITNEIRRKPGHLSHLVVYHHIVWLDIPMHDPHAVTVVQSLSETHTQVIMCWAWCKTACSIWSLAAYLPWAAHTGRNVYQNLLASGTGPTETKCID